MVMVKDKNINAQKQRLIILTCISGVLVLPPVLFLLQFLLGSFPGPLAQLTAKLQNFYDKNGLLILSSTVFILRLLLIKVTDAQPGMRAAKTTALLCNCITLITALRLYENTAIQDIVQFAANWLMDASVPQIIVIGIVLLAFLGVFIWMVHRASKDPISKPAPAGDRYPPSGGSGGTPNDPPGKKSTPFITVGPLNITGQQIRSVASCIIFIIAVAGTIFSVSCFVGAIEVSNTVQMVVVIVSGIAWALVYRNSTKFDNIRNNISSPIAFIFTAYLVVNALKGDEIGSKQWWSYFFSFLENNILASTVFLPFTLLYFYVIIQSIIDILVQKNNRIAMKIRAAVEYFEENLIDLVDTLLTTTVQKISQFIKSSVAAGVKVFFDIDDL